MGLCLVPEHLILERPLLEGMHPYLLEKKKQARLVLDMEKDQGWAVKAKLRAMKGNYTAANYIDMPYDEEEAEAVAE